MKLVNTYIVIISTFILSINQSDAQSKKYTLSECIDTALAYNKTLEINRNNVKISKERIDESKNNLIPKVVLNSEYRYYNDLPYQLMPLSTFNAQAPEGQYKEAQFGVPHNINANIALNMPLYNAQINGQIQITKIASEITELQHQKIKEEIVYEIHNLYYNAQVINQQIVFINQNIQNLEKLLRNIEILNTQLLAKKSDIDKTKLQLTQLKIQRENTIAKKEQIYNRLKIVMGISLNKDIEIDNKLNSSEIAFDTQKSSIDILITNTHNKLLNEEIKTLRRARLLPSINLNGVYGRTGFGYDKQPNEFLKFYPISYAGIQLSYPLFNANGLSKKIKQKQYEIDNNIIYSSLIKDQQEMQIINTKNQLEVARQSMVSSENQIKIAQEIYEQTTLQHKEGVASLNDLLLADYALREAQNIYLNTSIEYLKATLELNKIYGIMVSNK